MSDLQNLQAAIAKLVGSAREKTKVEQLLNGLVVQMTKQSQAIKALVNHVNGKEAERQRVALALTAWQEWYYAHRMVRFIARPPSRAAEVGGSHEKTGGGIVTLGAPVIGSSMVSRNIGGEGTPNPGGN